MRTCCKTMNDLKKISSLARKLTIYLLLMICHPLVIRQTYWVADQCLVTVDKVSGEGGSRHSAG